jgi:hypothetical protein
MALVIRVPKERSDLSRKDAVYRAREIALEEGHSEQALRRSTSRMEEVEGTVPWEYVIEFPDHVSTS